VEGESRCVIRAYIDKRKHPGNPGTDNQVVYNAELCVYLGRRISWESSGPTQTHSTAGLKTSEIKFCMYISGASEPPPEDAHFSDFFCERSGSVASAKFRVYGLGFRVWDFFCERSGSVASAKFRVWDLGFEIGEAESPVGLLLFENLANVDRKG
jgi:hypothetical protein